MVACFGCTSSSRMSGERDSESSLAYNLRLCFGLVLVAHRADDTFCVFVLEVISASENKITYFPPR